MNSTDPSTTDMASARTSTHSASTGRAGTATRRPSAVIAPSVVGAPPLRRRGQGGFTMIELIIVVALAAVVLVPMFGLLNMTYERLHPVREDNNDAQQMRVFRTTLMTDWARARVIRLNRTDLVEPNRSLTNLRMDCRGGMYGSYVPYSAQSQALRPVSRPAITPLFAINTHVAGNNNGLRVIYTAFTYDDPRFPGNDARRLTDIVRRQCGHRPQVLPQAVGGLDYWADDCPGGGAGATCTIPSPTTANPNPYTAQNTERVLIRGIREFRSPTSCNNLTTNPPYRACDVNLSLVGVGGQFTTIRLYQQVASTGLMVQGIANSNIGLDMVGRRS